MAGLTKGITIPLFHVFPTVAVELQVLKRKETASQLKQKNLTMLTAASRFSERSSITTRELTQSTFSTDREFYRDAMLFLLISVAILLNDINYRQTMTHDSRALV